MTMRAFNLTLIGLLLTGSNPATAQNVDLSTLPARSTVQLTIYNSADLTLVRETRRVSFKPGRNLLQFSWSGTRIDPTSVELRFLSHAADLELADTTFPHAKPQMLYWNVESERAGDAMVEVSYFTAGISWAADYVAVADEEGRSLALESFVRVNNQSGEDYEGAKVRLVVGSLNLVQRIADLAGVAPAKLQEMAGKKVKMLRHRAARRAMDLGDESLSPSAAGVTNQLTRPKDVTKESLSEYYLFSVEGSETVPHGWSKRLRSFHAAEVPYRVVHRYRPAKYGDQLVRLIVTKNDKASKLGRSPLPDGVVRVFARQDEGSLAYRGQQSIRYVPVGEDLEISLGPDPSVVFELVPLQAWRDEFAFHNASVVGWDEHVVYAQRIRNYSASPVELEIRRAFQGHARFVSELEAKKHDLHTVEVHAQVGANSNKDLQFLVSTSFGRRAKQTQITLQQADPMAARP